MKKYKFISKLMTFTLLFMLVLGCQKKPNEMDILEISLYKGEVSAPIYVADQLGYMNEEGLKLRFIEFDSGKLAFEDLKAGNTKITTASDSVILSNPNYADNVRILAVLSTAEIIEFFIPYDPDINTINDLLGHRIGTTRGSASEYILESHLLLNGITMDQVELIDMNPPEMEANLLADNVDAVYSWNPNIYNLAQDWKGDYTILEGQRGNPFYFLLIADKGWLDTHHKQTISLLSAIKKGVEYLRNNEKSSKSILMERFHLDEAYMDYSWTRHFYTLSLPQSLVFAMENQLRWINRHDKKVDLDFKSIIDDSWLNEVNPQGVTIIRE
ncbi:ABC transporter substrate-binding protein [Spirochaeta cellobiosiphila]|uniref:ABC transporter substrate-binding protein n=1 Tax=Spirochaeta cellobiosiphila TaxID=504483 RepID=UPI00048A8529|nr:ABC transporter substrate-binding protein [Spirochaeta cellobiosiphila]